MEYLTYEYDIQDIRRYTIDKSTDTVWASLFFVCCWSCTNARAGYNLNKTANQSAHCLFLSLSCWNYTLNSTTSSTQLIVGTTIAIHSDHAPVLNGWTLKWHAVGSCWLYSCLLWDHYETRSIEPYPDFLACLFITLQCSSIVSKIILLCETKISPCSVECFNPSGRK